HGARVLPLNGGEEPFNVVVRTDADALNAFVGLENDNRNLTDARIDEPVHVSNGPAPVVVRAQQAVARDFHVSPFVSGLVPLSACKKRWSAAALMEATA